ncbi:cytochrome c [Pseudoflavitalea sp. X16]|uniref:c-type cytochrome n=1 Tax=Paraflavitalea devenefica TaxID=2716334 RepID=UPI00141FD5A0|nr:c-type cytochrome [Paraflavitalea devenefica]NII27812.1 cytochrome c [Paraflavitalea devenefica]
MKLKMITAATIIYGALLFTASCGNEGVKTETTDPAATSPQELANNQPETHGIEIKEGDITITSPLQKDLVSAGKSIYELKCQACHKLNEEKLVGPGWKDVTKKRKPVWIMNMITNTEAMLTSDPEAQKLLEQCLVRMPNQNISKDEARQILEFMRENDGEK